MSEILFATTNEGKLREVKMIAAAHGLTVVGMKEAMPGREIPEVDETGTTYEFNCREKAVAYQEMFKCPVLVDDSGIEVDALGGAPGVYAAVYAGKGKTSQQHIEKLWSELRRVAADEASVTATMISCVIYFDGTKEFLSYGRMKGRILFEKQGVGGFGYDSIFVPEGRSETVSQIKDRGEKIVNHRGIAMSEIFEKISAVSSQSSLFVRLPQKSAI